MDIKGLPEGYRIKELQPAHERIGVPNEMLTIAILEKVPVKPRQWVINDPPDAPQGPDGVRPGWTFRGDLITCQREYKPLKFSALFRFFAKALDNSGHHKPVDMAALNGLVEDLRSVGVEVVS